MVQQREDVLGRAAEHPELIIIDLSMPGMNGLELIEAVKALCPSTLPSSNGV